MTPGVISIVADASLNQVSRALEAHHVHALLVVGPHDGLPIGWVTAHDVLRRLGGDWELTTAEQAVSERVTTIQPTADVGAAVYAFAMPGVNRLVVQRRPDVVPEGVLTHFDLAIAGSSTKREGERP